ncbi:MAG: PIN domain-containing protein [Leptospiraceae bacterium]|nr:PIN domain-containing protein [Leptospiraceae bacterium]MCP5497207.1 PIN domain-containing protein [Leptospiraceae bacterium]
MNYILDACSLIAYFNQEHGADKLEKILEQNEKKFISVINVFEVCYDLERSTESVRGMDIFTDIENLPIEIIYEFDKEHLEKAIYYKNTFKVSVADSLALGLAEKLNGVLVTSDHHEFDSIENSGKIRFLWIR